MVRLTHRVDTSAANVCGVFDYQKSVYDGAKYEDKQMVPARHR